MCVHIRLHLAVCADGRPNHAYAAREQETAMEDGGRRKVEIEVAVSGKDDKDAGSGCTDEMR